ncbi:hypothetical protein [Anaeromassilibacillus senegalensis]|uniref:Uncharacterized protein n=1 Tax=Anaeromassilibacillus senegalensis TaxID=1673717 RepID=A0ABS9CNJ3_9FIRM|nr:hypothetical protein [Anaeromassilibacillus senegalensis]MCF2652723.1 hypothetical protein [Anaeromassilibacillus senegalensis]MCI5652616.1 hypothetical protein [Ruminococcus bromii]
MPNNMPDTRAINEALRRAREMQSRSAPAPEASEPAPQPEPQPAAPAPPENKQEMKPQPSGKHISPLDLLLKDRERTLILALLILLSSEDSNTELLFALMYLLI